MYVYIIQYFGRLDIRKNMQQSGRPCLLQVMKDKSSNDKDSLCVLWDGGATTSLITFDKAKELNLVEESVKLCVVCRI